MKKIHIEIILIALIVVIDFITQNAGVRDYLIGTLILSQVVLLGMELKTKLGSTLVQKTATIQREVSVSKEMVTSDDAPGLSKIAV